MFVDDLLAYRRVASYIVLHVDDQQGAAHVPNAPTAA